MTEEQHPLEPLRDEVVARNGSLDSDALKAYAAAGGAAGGAGLCVALGVTAAAAPACGWLGGKIGGWVAENFPVAKGSDLASLVQDTWRNMQPLVKAGSDRLAAAAAYGALRDARMAELSNLANPSGALTAIGAPPLAQMWPASYERWREWNYLRGKLGENPCGRAIGGFSKSEATVAVESGLVPDCITWRNLLWGFGPFTPLQPPAPGELDPSGLWSDERALERLEAATSALREPPVQTVYTTQTISAPKSAGRALAAVGTVAGLILIGRKVLWAGV